jgi:DnaK suppressor protein
MTEKQRKEFKRFASEEIESLRAQIPRLEALLEPVAPDSAIGRISRMDNIVNQSVSESQLSKAKVRLARLREALRRVDDDEDFGLCIDCGEPIPMARLKAMPETQYCVECAE